MVVVYMNVLLYQEQCPGKWPAVELVAACSLFKGWGWELGQADNFFYNAAF